MKRLDLQRWCINGIIPLTLIECDCKKKTLFQKNLKKNHTFHYFKQKVIVRIVLLQQQLSTTLISKLTVNFVKRRKS